MKKLFLFITTFFLMNLVYIYSASADIWDYTNDVTPNPYINNDNYVPNTSNWYALSLPTWYNSNNITAFTIDIYGYGDNSSYPIDIWRKLGDTSAIAKKIVGFDVVNNLRPFILRMDMMDGILYRNYKKSDGTWSGFIDTTKDLQNISLEAFNGLDNFLIGFACHFYYDKTSIHIEQQAVPEPATLLLLGFGLVGLAGAGRKFKK